MIIYIYKVEVNSSKSKRFLNTYIFSTANIQNIQQGY